MHPHLTCTRGQVASRCGGSVGCAPALARCVQQQQQPHGLTSLAPAGRRAHLPTCRASDKKTEKKTAAPAASLDLKRFANKKALDAAAKRYAIGLQQGIDEDELIALELGYPTGLTEAQQPYLDKIKERLIQRAEELRQEEEEEKARLLRKFTQGKRAYEYGEYQTSVTLLEQAVEDAGGPTAMLAGEVQLWLALAYQACGREQEAIDLYKAVESSHPASNIRKQAAELRYILEAPKLEISKDEWVEIPLIQSETWRRKDDRKSAPRGPAKMAKLDKPKKKSYWDVVDWDIKPPLPPLPDKWYVRVAWTAVLLGVTLYLNWSYVSSKG